MEARGTPCGRNLGPKALEAEAATHSATILRARDLCVLG